MKIVSAFLVIILFSNCQIISNQEKKYYYDKESSDVYLAEGSRVVKYNLLDSIKEIGDIHGNDLELSSSKYTYHLNNDNLILTSDNLEISLNRLHLKNLQYDDIRETAWKMEVEKQTIDQNKKYLEEQILRINTSGWIDAYYVKDNDTIYGAKYEFSGKLFDQFLTFKRGYETILIRDLDNESIQIILNNGYNISLEYSFQKIEFDQLSKL